MAKKAELWPKDQAETGTLFGQDADCPVSAFRGCKRTQVTGLLEMVGHGIPYRTWYLWQ